ncbi:MAG: hypothetical protein P1Q69_09220 [Candidatus Thorarchaeota archaeon]|nr:hypothetical protein [Candidatus Thorarchaeota archaeon]
MLFLSDGQPTAGEITHAPDILSGLKDANCECVSISTVAFGSNADESLMANLASQNNGFFALIGNTDDAATKLIDFYKVWATPVASSFSIESTGASEFFTLQPYGGVPFFNGSEVVICGRYGSSLSIETSVAYTAGTETYINSALDGGDEYPHIERIWAQYKISWMLEMVRLEGSSASWREQIIALAMQYGLVVDGYTGLILVAEEEIDSTGTVTETTTQTSTDYQDYPYTAAPPPTATYATGTQPPALAAAWPIDPLWIGLVGGVGLGILALGAIVILTLIKRQRAS